MVRLLRIIPPLLCAIVASQGNALADCSLSSDQSLADAFIQQTRNALGADFDPGNAAGSGKARSFYANVAQRMISAGYVANGIDVLKRVVDENHVNPDYALINISLARAYRIMGSELVDPSAFSDVKDGKPPTPSNISELRLSCLDRGEKLLHSAIQTLEQDLSAEKADKASTAPISAEATLNLLGSYKVEIAQILRDEGDLNYRTVLPDDFLKRLAARALNDGDGNTGIEKIALERYRQAQIALAEAATIGRDEQQGTIRLVSQSIETRLTWLRAGEAFGGLAYGGSVRPIGVEVKPNDVLGFTILSSIEKEKDALQRAGEAYENARTEALDRLNRDLGTFATTYAESQSYRLEHLSALEQELTRVLNERQGLGVSLAELEDVRNQRVADLKEAADARVKELEGERNAAVTRANEALGSLRIRVDTIRRLGPYSTKNVPVTSIAAFTPEDVAVMGAFFGACSKPLSPDERPGSQDVWKSLKETKKLDDKLPPELKDFLNSLRTDIRASSAETIKASNLDSQFESQIAEVKVGVDALEASDGTGSQIRNDADLRSDWEKLTQQCWELARQLQVEQALLANTRVEIHRDELEKLQNNIAAATKNAGEKAINDLKEAENGTEQDLKQALHNAQDKVAEAARDQVIEEIDRINDRIKEVNGIIDQVIKTGQDVEKAVQAAQVVFTTAQAIPVGSGPGGVIFEHDSLIAVQNSAIELARFTYRATNDVLEIKRQIAELQDRLNEHAAHLKSLKLSDEITKLERKAGESMDQFRDRAQKRLSDTQAKLGQIYNETAEVIAAQSKELVDSSVRLSDSKAALVKAELGGVVRSLDRLADERRSLRTEQEVALLDLAHGIAAVRDGFLVADDLQQQIGALRAEISNGLQERQASAQRPIEKIRDQDAALALRVETLLNQIEEVRAGKDGDDPWFAARQFAAQFLAAPPSLNDDLLVLYTRYRQSLDRMNALTFEFANALFYLTQDRSVLGDSIQVSSASEAGELIQHLYKRYQSAIRLAAGGASPQIVSLEILRADAARWGRIESGEEGAVFPKCLKQNAGGDARCLRITTTRADLSNINGPYNSPRCRPPPHVQDPLNSALQESTVLRPANGGAMFNGVARCRADDGTNVNTMDLLPTAPSARPTELRGELIFDVDRAVAQGQKDYLVDAVMAEPTGDIDVRELPSDFHPIGATAQTCRDGQFSKTWTIPQPTQLPEDSGGALKRSLVTLNPGLAQQEIDTLLATLHNEGLESVLGEAAGGRRVLFSGRGISNSFEIKLTPNSDGKYELSADIYIFLIFLPFPCEVSREGNSGETAYHDPIVALLDTPELAPERAPVARSLVTLEKDLAAAKASSMGGPMQPLSRLTILEDLLSLTMRSSPTSDKNILPKDRLLEERAVSAFESNWSRYLDAIKVPPSEPQGNQEALKDLVRCATDGRLVCASAGPSEADGKNFEDAAVVDMPIPLPIYDRLVRRVMLKDKVKLNEFATPNGPDGTLPEELRRKIAHLVDAVHLYDRSQAFADRAVTTTQALLDAKSAVERRLRFVQKATRFLTQDRPDPSQSIRAALCAATLFENPGFWYLAQGWAESETTRKSTLSFSTFNSSCWPGKFNASSCQPPIISMAQPKDQLALDLGAACQRVLDLSPADSANLFNSSTYFGKVVTALTAGSGRKQ
jgi:hypothetical protein